MKEHKLVCEELRHLFESSSQQDNASSLFTSYLRRHTPLMEPAEWHQHCDVILRANAALNLKMLIQLITARVHLMATAYGISGPACASKVFCGSEYVPNPSSDDKELFDCQKICCVHLTLIALLCGITVYNRSNV